MTSNQPDQYGFVVIGEHTACVDGDHRYSTKVLVRLDGDGDVNINILENGAANGMDGPGDATGFRCTGTRVIPRATPQQVAKAVREVCSSDEVMKRYGKATKKFKWGLTSASQVMNRGISVRVVTNAFNQYREMYGDEGSSRRARFAC